MRLVGPVGLGSWWGLAGLGVDCEEDPGLAIEPVGPDTNAPVQRSLQDSVMFMCNGHEQKT